MLYQTGTRPAENWAHGDLSSRGSQSSRQKGDQLRSLWWQQFFGLGPFWTWLAICGGREAIFLDPESFSGQTWHICRHPISYLVQVVPNAALHGPSYPILWSPNPTSSQTWYGLLRCHGGVAIIRENYSESSISSERSAGLIVCLWLVREGCTHLMQSS